MVDLEDEGTSGLLYRGDHGFVAAVDSDFRFVFAAGDGPAASVTLHLGGREIPGPRKKRRGRTDRRTHRGAP